MPSVQDLRRDPSQHPNWLICPVCHGGRGEAVPVYDTGREEMTYQIQECSLCHGDKVIPRPERTPLDLPGVA